jgi:hypothetical protein
MAPTGFPRAQEAAAAAGSSSEDTPLVRTVIVQPQQQGESPVAEGEEAAALYQHQPALLPGADPAMAAAFEEGAFVGRELEVCFGAGGLRVRFHQM